MSAGRGGIKDGRAVASVSLYSLRRANLRIGGGQAAVGFHPAALWR
jgi:hypothetical protein